jgi:crossover junction endodeoxyribonuclease RuvC
VEKQECTIIGIDPGTSIMGYGLIKVLVQEIKIIQYGVIDLRKYPCQETKLQEILDHTLQIIDEFKPHEAALEAPFYGRNVQSLLKLGQAQGVAMAAVLMRKIPLTEYAPRKIKQAVTGHGNASKEQVANMLAVLLNFQKTAGKLDATDALAVAVCHAHQQQNNPQKDKGWKSFIANHPDRLLQKSYKILRIP